SVQVAFARVGLSWQDAEFVSLHGSVRREWVVDDLPLLCERYKKLVVLTGGENTPSKLARMLSAKSAVHVLERLGYPDERVTSGTPEDISRGEFENPNLMIVLTPETDAPVFGLREDEFRHERSLITKDEVRAVAIHKLRLPLSGVLWDVGSGSGSVGIEARRLSPGLRVYAIERDSARAEDIRHNARVLAAGEINIVEGEAPEAFDELADLAAPDRVFIGGGGASLKEIVNASVSAMEAGIVVVSTITIESLTEAVAELKSLGLTPEVTSLSVSRSKDVGGREYLKAENQIFLIKVEKPVNG
ncbi:MAG: precorrin-6Y C5,15-methyltransferase (decarboxylating) subunit CbiT, partial [Thermodesulfovibrionales bacterium]|nr:precorrin-6Y C5,15-methyltransferase (decarboxylating) subunit CbiT [Thermodesulfovibrionales bacterium]